MQKFINAVFKCPSRRYSISQDRAERAHARSRKTFEKAIEIQFGNVISLTGFTPYQDASSNQIGLSSWEIILKVILTIWKSLTRNGTLLVLIHALIAIGIVSSNHPWSKQYFTYSLGDIMLLYMTPVFITTLTFCLRELNLVRLRISQLLLQDQQKCKIFKQFKRNIKSLNARSDNNNAGSETSNNQIKPAKIEPHNGVILSQNQNEQGSELPMSQQPESVGGGNQISPQIYQIDRQSTPLSETRNAQKPKLSILQLTKQYQGDQPTRSRMNSGKTVKLFEELTWSQLEVGHIVWLQRGEIVPADMLLLDSRQSLCTLEETSVSGQTTFVSKQPSQLTSVSAQSKLKTNAFEYRKLLSGKVEFNRISKCKEFNGFIKMRKDPKGEPLGINNLLFRGSHLVSSDWVFGLVLYVGKDCKVYQQNYREGKVESDTSFFGKKARMFFFLAYLQVIFNVTVSVFFGVMHPFQQVPPNSKVDVFGIIMAFFLEYMHILPQLFYAINDIIWMINDLHQNKKYLKNAQELSDDEADKNTQDSYQIQQNVSIGDLALTNYVFLDKTGTLTDGENHEVRGILVDSKIYCLDEKIIQLILSNKTNHLASNNFQKSLRVLPDPSDSMIVPEEKKEISFCLPTQEFQLISDKNLKQNQQSFLQNNTQNASFHHSNILTMQDEIKSNSNSPPSHSCSNSNNSFSQHQSQLASSRYQQFLLGAASQMNSFIQNCTGSLNQPLESNFIRKSMTKIKNSGSEDIFEDEEEECRDKIKNPLSQIKLKYLQSQNSSPDRQFLNTSGFLRDHERSERSKLTKISDSSRQSNNVQSQGENNILDEAAFINSLHSEDDTKHHESLLAITICNQVASHFNSQTNLLSNEFDTKEAEIVSNFAKTFDYSLKCASVYKGQTQSPNYILNIQGNLVSYKILAINQNTDNRQFFSILFRDSNSSSPNIGSILFSKSALQTQEIPEQILFREKEDRKRLEKQIGMLLQKGLRPVIYCKRELSDEQTDEYLRQYENLQKNLVQDTQKLESLYSELEKDMQIVCVLGIAEKLRKRAQQTVRNMRLAGLRTWMLTGDSFMPSLAAAYQSSIIDTDSSIFHLEGGDYNQLKLVIREQLNLILNESKQNNLIPQNISAYQSHLYQILNETSNTKLNEKGKNEETISRNSEQQLFQTTSHGGTQTPYKIGKRITQSGLIPMVSPNQFRNKSQSGNLNAKQFLFSIAVSSEALNIIISDNYLKNHFIFLSYFCVSLVGYNLKASQKSWLVHMTKHKFPQNPRSLAIGDSYNDFDMMKTADMAIQIHNSRFNVELLGDIMVREFDTIQNLLFSDSRFMAELQEELLLFSFYRSFLVGNVLLIINIRYNIFVVSLWDSLQLLFYYLFFYSVNLASYLAKKYSKKHQHKIDPPILLRQFEKSTQIFKKRKNISFFYKIICHSLFEALIISFVIAAGINIDFNDSGKNISFIAVSNLSFILIAFCSSLKMVVISRQNFKEGFVTVFLNIVISTLYLPLSEISQNYPFTFKDLFEQFTLSSRITVIIISLLSFLFMVNLFLEYCLYIPSFFPAQMIRNREKYIKLYSEQDGKEKNYDKQNKLLWKKKSENIIHRLISGIFHTGNQEEMDVIIKNSNEIIQEIMGLKEAKQYDFEDYQTKKINLFLSMNSVVSSDEMSEKNTEYHRISLQFKDADIETKFKQNIVKNWLKFSKYSQLGVLIIFEMAKFIIQSAQSSKAPQIGYLIEQILGIIILSFVTALLFTSKGEKKFYQINGIILSVRVTIKIFTELILIQNSNPLESFGFSLSMIFSVLCRPDIAMIALIIESVLFISKYLLQSQFNSSLDQYCSLSIVFLEIAQTLFCIQTKYHVQIKDIFLLVFFEKYETVERQDYLSQNRLSIESTKLNNILAILLPKFVRERISNNGEIQLAENQGDVGVLLCDICDFDRILESENERIVVLLDNLFRTFDVLCSQNECTKIETVGKTYVAASGLRLEQTNGRKKTQGSGQSNSVEKLINLAFGMQEYVKNVAWGKHGDKMRVKIGIHFGRVMAGVIGYHKPQFSLIGDTINTTSRVMSTGEDNRLTISEQAQQQIQSCHIPFYRFNRREVEAKGKGILVTFQVFKVSQKQLKGTKTEFYKTNRIRPNSGLFKQKLFSPIKRNQLNSTDFSQDEIRSFDINSPLQSRHLLHKMSSPKLKQSQSQNQHLGSPNPVQTPLRLAMGGIHNLTIARHSSRKQVRQTIFQLNQQIAQLPSGDCKHKETIQRTGPSQYKGNKPRQDSGTESISSRNSILLKIEQTIKEEVHVECQQTMAGNEVELDFVNELFESIEEERGEKAKPWVHLSASSLYLSLDESKPETLEFYEDLFQSSKKSIQLKYLAFMQFLTAKSLISLCSDSFLQESYIGSIVNRSVLCLGLYILYWTRNKFLFCSLTRFRASLMVSLLLLIIAQTMETFGISFNDLSQEENNLVLQVQSAEIILTFVILTSFQCFKFLASLVIFLFLIAQQLFFSILLDADRKLLYFAISTGAAYLFHQYLLFRLQIKAFNNLRNLSSKTKEQSHILSNLLPKHVLEKFLNNPETTRLELVDIFEDVTILFADIAGFTKYSSQVEPEQVVNMLKKLFYEFDKACQQNEIFKLYTIGDCYVVISFTDSRKRNPETEAKNVVSMAFQMIEIIKDLRAQVKFEQLDMRIGVHTGKIIGGVIGTDIVRYDIYGKDVVIANKMESSGEQGRILVSNSTRKLLESFEYLEFVEDKGVFCKSIDQTVQASFVQQRLPEEIEDLQQQIFRGTNSLYDLESNEEHAHASVEQMQKSKGQQQSCSNEMKDNKQELSQFCIKENYINEDQNSIHEKIDFDKEDKMKENYLENEQKVFDPKDENNNYLESHLVTTTRLNRSEVIADISSNNLFSKNNHEQNNNSFRNNDAINEEILSKNIRNLSKPEFRFLQTERNHSNKQDDQ